MPRDQALSTPSSTSWGSLVRAQYRPFPELPSAAEGEANSAYHASAGWSKSQLWDHASRGARYFYLRHVARSIQSEESAALAHGTRLHRWLEVGERLFEELVAPPEDTLTETGQVGKKAQQWALENAPGMELVSGKEIKQLRREIDAVMEHRAARKLIEEAVAHEVSVRWEGPDGQLLRCRPDLISQSAWVDLKTTKEADILDSFWKSVVTYGYHAQDAHYQWGMEALGMDPRPLNFVVVSTVWPHQCHVVTLPLDLVSDGRRRLMASLADIRIRMDLDYWMPDQHGEVVELPVPAHIRRMS
jgi:hypothetical protein